MPPTGEPRVDAALDRLGELDQAPLSRHVEVYEAVHTLLHDALSGLDEE